MTPLSFNYQSVKVDLCVAATMRLVVLLSSFLLIVLTTFVVRVASKSDDSPGFFLKVTKSIPRLGRRADNAFFWRNASKQIPRIGRRNENDENLATVTDRQAWLDELPNPVKRILLTPVSDIHDREYSVVQPVNSNTLIELLEKDAIQKDNVKFVHWKDFDRALQSDPDLYAKVISLGRKPDHRLFGNTNDDDNVGGDLLFHTGHNQMYPKYDREFLHYNEVD